MSLTKIKGSTYYLNAPTNCGVYSFKNKNCLIIDTGINNTQAKKLEEAVLETGLHPKYIINTHSHHDHCGGNSYFTSNYPGCSTYTSEKEKIMMENPFILSAALFSFENNKALDITNKSVNVDNVLNFGENKINDEKFDIISLKGHSIGQIGIVTPEKVCFVGDSIFSKEIISKYSLPYIINIKDELDTLDTIKSIDADYFVISHSEKVLEKSEIAELADINIKNINDYIAQIMELLEQPLSRENLLENLIILNELPVNSFHQYHIYFTTISSFLTYLYSLNKIEYSMENGNVFYFAKSV